MKNIVYLFFALLIASCSVQERPTEEESAQSINLEEIVDGFEHDVAFFKTENELNIFISEFTKLQYQEKQTILKKIKFKTIRQSLDEVYLKMNSLNEEKDFYLGKCKLDKIILC